MLNLFRQGGVIKALMGGVVLLIIAAFALDFRGGGGVDSEQRCVVEVDGECVQAKDYNMLIRLVGPAGATDKELREAGFINYAINALIERELLLKEARRLGVGISEQELDDELAMGRVHYSWPVEAPLPQAVSRGLPYPVTGASETVTYVRVRNTKTDAFDYEIYRRQIQNLLRMSPREFKARQEQELVAARVRAAITSPIRVGEDEVFAAFERDRSQATVRSVNVRRSWFERFAVAGGDVEQFAKDNSADVDSAWEAAKAAWKPDCPLVSEILLSFSAGADASEQQIKSEQAQVAESLLREGVPFATVARALGDGPLARKGGALGCLEASSYPAGAEELLQALEGVKVGATSKIVETPRGFHILLNHGSHPQEEAERIGRAMVASAVMFEKAATEAAKSYAAEVIAKAKAGDDLTDANQALLASKVNVAGLSEKAAAVVLDAAKQASDAPEFDVSRPFPRGGSPLPGLKQGDVAQKVFALAEPGALIDEPLETYTGFAVIQLKEKDMATREQFEESKDDLMAALKEQKRADALANYIARLKKQATQIFINPAYSKPPSDGAAATEEAPADSG